MSLEIILREKERIFPQITHQLNFSLNVMKNISLANHLGEKSKKNLFTKLEMEKAPSLPEKVIRKDMKFSSKLFSGLKRKDSRLRKEEAFGYLEALKKKMAISFKKEIKDFDKEKYFLLYEKTGEDKYIKKAKDLVGQSEKDRKIKNEFKRNQVKIEKYRDSLYFKKILSELSEELRGKKLGKTNGNFRKHMSALVEKHGKETDKLGNERKKIAKSFVRTTGYTRGLTKNMAFHIAYTMGTEMGIKRDQIKKILDSPEALFKITKVMRNTTKESEDLENYYI